MSDVEMVKLSEEIDSKFNRLLDRFNQRYELDAYANSAKIRDYFGLDKPTFHKLLKEGMPLIQIGKRWKGKIREVEAWFKSRNEVKITN